MTTSFLKSRLFGKATLVAVGASLLLSACQTTGSSTHNANGEPLTPAEIRMREQAATYNATIAEGAVVGCLLGAGIGLLAGSSDALAHAAVGCAAGGALGAGAGAYVADKQEQYANKEDQLDAMIADVQADNERLEQLMASVRDVIDQDKARIEQAERQLAAGTISMQQAKARMASVDANREYLDQTIDQLLERRNTYAAAADQMAKRGGRRSDMRVLEREIAQLESQIAQLQAERDSLARRRTVSRIG